MSYKHFMSADLLASFERIVKVTCGIPRERDLQKIAFCLE